jgi:protein-S-isoprenylcysteine O-methyltransferase Ste14
LNLVPTLRGAGLALLWFGAVYAPAFATVAWLHSNTQAAVPIIVAVSAGLAALIIVSLARGKRSIAEFGIARSPTSYVLAAAVVGVLVGGALAYLAALYRLHRRSMSQSSSRG